MKYRFLVTLKLVSLSLLTPAFAGELSLRPFEASYDLYKGGMHVAISELRLQRSGENWRYHLTTRPRGIFSWFIDEEPYAETTFSVDQDRVLLREIVIGDAGSKQYEEAARFDWNESRAEVMRKGKRKQLELAGGVYDYQTIHLLAASMGYRQLERTTVDFYRKGRLRKSRFAYAGERRIRINDKSRKANVYEQVINKSSSKMYYYYDLDNPLLLLRVEKMKSGESPEIMTLREAESNL